jgi:hypothetical protein
MSGALKELITLSETILKVYSRKTAISRKSNPILSRLLKYNEIVKRTEDVEHAPFFLPFYKSYRKDILDGPILKDEIKWITKDIVIEFGKGVLKKVDKDYSIHLSTIFNRSKELADLLTAECGDDVEALEKHEEINYPETLILYVYRLFYNMLDEKNDDRTKLKEKIISLEKIVGLEAEEIAPLSTSRNNNADIFSSLLGGLNNLKLPKDSNDGKMPDIANVFKQLTENPKTTDVFNKIAGQLSKCDNLGDMVSMVGKTLEDTDMKEIISDVVTKAENGITTKVITNTAVVNTNGPVGNMPASSAEIVETTLKNS